MNRYYVILAQDDNTVYRCYGFEKKKEAQQYAFLMADSAFIVVVISADVMRYSDNSIVKKAQKKL